MTMGPVAPALVIPLPWSFDLQPKAAMRTESRSLALNERMGGSISVVALLGKADLLNIPSQCEQQLAADLTTA
jgi:hypothetical protein